MMYEACSFVGYFLYLTVHLRVHAVNLTFFMAGSRDYSGHRALQLPQAGMLNLPSVLQVGTHCNM